MAVSPDDRFASLIDSSAERGGWVPGDVFTADTEGEEEPVAARRIRLPVLVALGLATVAVLLLALYVFRPAEQHDPAAGRSDTAGSVADSDTGGTSGSAESTAAGSGADANEAGANEAAANGGTANGGTANGGTANGGTANEAAADGKIVVHVTGAVRSPSVVTLDAGARVQDAVEAAGGLQSDADSEAVNLARVAQDGEKIHIPVEGEEPPADFDGAEGNAGAAGGTGGDSATDTGDSTGAGSASGTGSAGSGTGSGGKIDLNSADAAALQTLPGVGPVTAEAIIAHRQTQPFGSVDDLLLVKGIGPKTFESLRDRVSVG